ncbi:MAG TPA: DUF4097 family beta strand repeat-containing protein [Gemmatimonadales bacterium]|nr:DUF4097 family beta strand repeat-containing protein [Gemmatimonadales bacterium]
MLPVLAAVLALSASALQDTDTTFAVRQGQRLDVNDFGGTIDVKIWRQNAIKLSASHSSRDRIAIDLGDDATISIRGESRHGPPMVDYELTVPAWMPLNLSGVSTDINVDGVVAEIVAETVEGTINVIGGKSNVSLRSVNGDVTLKNAAGHVEVHSVDGGLDLTNVSGDIEAETVSGDISLAGITSADVDANTVDGGITYEGTIQDGGRYHFGSHSGDVTAAIPDKANATVSVATYNGEFQSCRPVKLVNKSKHRFTFTLGTGSARIEIESFDGDLNLACPGSIHAKSGEGEGASVRVHVNPHVRVEVKGDKEKKDSDDQDEDN